MRSLEQFAKMAGTKEENSRTNEDESKYENEKFLEKLKILAEKVGITVEEAVERKLSKNQLKKMIKNEVRVYRRATIPFLMHTFIAKNPTKTSVSTFPSRHSKQSRRRSAKGLVRNKN